MNTNKQIELEKRFENLLPKIKEINEEIKNKSDFNTVHFHSVFNALKCLNCKRLIFSSSHYDYRTCSCGQNSIDGGKNYFLRIIGENHEKLGCEIVSNKKIRNSKEYKKYYHEIMNIVEQLYQSRS